jgi:hypothetical protein
VEHVSILPALLDHDPSFYSNIFQRIRRGKTMEMRNLVKACWPTDFKDGWQACGLAVGSDIPLTGFKSKVR